MARKDRGNWMQTYSGNRFYPLDPRPEDFNLVDIAHSLSMQCRYNGHTTKFYSVAEHCVLVSREVENRDHPVSDALWGLLHDASEAYVGDMIRPLKLEIPAYSEIENKILWSMAQAFRLNTVSIPDLSDKTKDPTPESVKNADFAMLNIEKLSIMQPSMHKWNINKNIMTSCVIEGWSPETAKRRFIQRFEELTE